MFQIAVTSSVMSHTKNVHAGGERGPELIYRIPYSLTCISQI